MARKKNKNTGVDALSNAVGGGEGLTRQDKKERRQAANEMKRQDRKKKIEAAKGKVEGVVDEVKDKAVGVASKAKEKAEGVVDSAKEKVKDISANRIKKPKTSPTTEKSDVLDLKYGDTKMDIGDVFDQQQTQPTKSTYDRESEAAKKVAERVGGMNLTGVGQTPPSKGLEEEAGLKDSDKKPSRFFKQEQDKNALNLTENPNEIKSKVVENIQNDPTLTQEEKLEKIQDAQQIPLEIDKEIKGNEALIRAVEGDEDVKDDVDKNLTTSDFTQSRDDLMRAFQFEDPDFLKKAQFYKQLYDRNRGRNNAEPAIEKLGLTDYFPTMNQPIAVGSYSRKTLGSGNIYAPAGFTMPMGILDARNRAIQAAAKANKKKTDGLLKGMYVKSAPQFQAQIDDMSYKAIQEYTKAAGADLRVLTDPTNPLTQQFYKDMRDMQTFGQQTIDLNTRLEDLMKKATGADGERLYIPDALRDYMQKYYTGYEDAESMFRDKDWFRKFSDYVKSYDNLTHYADEWWAKAGTERGFDKVYFNPTKPPKNPEDYQKQSYQDDWAKIRSGNTDLHMSAYKKFFNVDKFRQAAKTLMANRYFSEEFTEDDITKYLMTMAGTKQGYDHINTYTGRLSYQAQANKLNLIKETRATTLSQDANSTLQVGAAAVEDARFDGTNQQEAYMQALKNNNLPMPSMVITNNEVKMEGGMRSPKQVIPVQKAVGNNKQMGFSDNAKIRVTRMGVDTYVPVRDFVAESKKILAKNSEKITAGNIAGAVKMTPLQIAAANDELNYHMNSIPNNEVSIKFTNEDGTDWGFDFETGIATGDLNKAKETMTYSGGTKQSLSGYYNQYGQRVTFVGVEEGEDYGEEAKDFKYEKRFEGETATKDMSYRIDVKEDQGMSQSAIANANSVLDPERAKMITNYALSGSGGELNQSFSAYSTSGSTEDKKIEVMDKTQEGN
jgi:hypothetical protein